MARLHWITGALDGADALTRAFAVARAGDLLILCGPAAAAVPHTRPVDLPLGVECRLLIEPDLPAAPAPWLEPIAMAQLVDRLDDVDGFVTWV